MFVNVDNNDINYLYNVYQTGEYKGFFRHLDDFLNKEEFITVLSSYKWLKHETGFISLMVYPKPKLCMISILVEEEHQGKGNGLSTMKEIGEYVFNNGVERCVVLVLEEDEHTVKMCEKGGFDKEGIYINSCKVDNELKNEIRFGMDKKKYLELYGGSHG